VGLKHNSYFLRVHVCVDHSPVLTVIAVVLQSRPAALFVWLRLPVLLRPVCVCRKLMNWDEDAAEVTETVDGTTFGFF
jgi:hypothetical protein